MKNEGLTIPLEWGDMFDALDDVSAAALVRAALTYVRMGRTPAELPRDVLPVFLIVKGMIDRQAEEKRLRSERARAAVRARWAKKRAKTAPAETGSEGQQDKTDRTNRTDSGAAANTNDTTVYDRIQMNTEHTDVSSRIEGQGNEAAHDAPARDTQAPEARAESTFTLNSESISTDSKQKRKRIKEKIKAGLAQYYHRRASTVWSQKEIAELRKVCERPDAESEYEAIMAAYSSGYGYTRGDILTLLRNWSCEFDRAQRFNQQHTGGDQHGTSELKQRYGI